MTDEMRPIEELMVENADQRREFLREIAILRDTPAGNEICRQDPLPMLGVLVKRARELLGMPPWVPPCDSDPLWREIIRGKVQAAAFNGALDIAAATARSWPGRSGGRDDSELANLIAEAIEAQKIENPELESDR